MLRRTIGPICFVLLSPTIAGSAGPASPMAWSPDGAWLAYVAAAPDGPDGLDTSWIFRGRDEGRPAGAADGPPAPRRHRLWATRIGSEPASVLLDESPGPIVPPAWRPDGRALAFGRVVPTPDGRARYEVVRVEGTDRRILFAQAIDDPARDAPALAASAVAWSGDGRLLAVPRARPAGLAILRAETGSVVKTIESAASPAWSPPGNRLFYIAPAGPGRDAIEYIDGHLGAAKRVAEIGRSDGPVVVARDGQSVVLIGRASGFPDGPGRAERLELDRIRLDGLKERVMASIGPPIDPARGIVSASLAQDRDGENVFAALVLPAQPCQVYWLRPRDRGVHKPFPVLDPMLALGDLALSPDGATLALRVGPPGPSGLAIVCDLDSMTMTPLAPDDQGRDAWLAFLLATARTILREDLPPPILSGRAVGRAVALPIPGELDDHSETMARLGRLARAAQGLPGGGPGDLARDEARFLFDYLRQDYPAALARLDRLAAVEPTDERRLKALGLRGQVFAGLGDLDRARDAFLYLRGVEPSRARVVVEETSRGPVVSRAEADDAGWAEYALARVDALARQAAKQEAEETVGHANPDAPAPGLGLDLEPIPRPVMPEPPPPPGLRFRGLRGLDEPGPLAPR